MELKPCPFCGPSGDVRAVEIAADCHVVRCKTCLCEGPSRRMGSKADAITAWNTRTESARIATLEAERAELVEALREAREALHFHYVEWDGEPEDAVPLQLARSKIDALLSRLSPNTSEPG